MSGIELLVALAIAVGLVGIVVPVLPGSILVLLAVLGWAWSIGEPTGWVIFAVASAVLIVGGVVKFILPHQQLKEAGVPASTQWFGAALGIGGFFVIPVVGLFVGFVLGVYVAELRRLGPSAAWPSSRRALSAIGIGIFIELAAALVATLIWVTGVVLT